MKITYTRAEIEELFNTEVEQEAYEVLICDVYADMGVVDGREVLQINMTLIETKLPATLTEIKNEE